MTEVQVRELLAWLKHASKKDDRDFLAGENGRRFPFGKDTLTMCRASGNSNSRLLYDNIAFFQTYNLKDDTYGGN